VKREIKPFTYSDHWWWCFPWRIFPCPSSWLLQQPLRQHPSGQILSGPQQIACWGWPQNLQGDPAIERCSADRWWREWSHSCSVCCRRTSWRSSQTSCSACILSEFAGEDVGLPGFGGRWSVKGGNPWSLGHPDPPLPREPSIGACCW